MNIYCTEQELSNMFSCCFQLAKTTYSFNSCCRKGNIYCCQEIRNFVIQYNIKQQQIAVLAGLYLRRKSRVC